MTTGRGPDECQLAISGLLKVLQKEALSSKVEYEYLDSEDGPYGPLSALVALRGEGADALAQSWKGSIKWICQSSIRPTHRRKNWFVGVSILSPPPTNTIIKDSDLRYDTLRSSGPGGQHVNRTESAVRLVHLPTGITIMAQEERSQHRNKALALARLNKTLADKDQANVAESEKDRWSSHNDLERGNEIRIYSGEDFRRIK